MHIIIDGWNGRNSYCCARFGYGSGAIHMNDLSCSGTEHKLLECGYSSGTNNHRRDWSISCKDGQIVNTHTYNT